MIDAIQICLDLGADVNAVNSMGVTAMIGAANRGSNDIIRLLHAKGARLDVVDKQGRSPLRWAEGVFLATTGAEIKPETIALLQELAGESAGGPLAYAARCPIRCRRRRSRGGGRWCVCVLPTPHTERERRRAVGDVDRYCEDCHNDAERAGDLAFDRLDPSRMHADAAVWETVIRKLRGGLMPPPGEPRPVAERLDTFVGFLEESLDAAARTAPNPGMPGLRRLNRTEYANALRDLIELPVDAEALLPGDDSVAGFDNIGSALSISPTLLQAYVSAAATLSRLAVGDPTASPRSHLPRAARLAERQPRRRPAAWYARRLSSPARVPLDAEYEIRITARSEDEVEPALDGRARRVAAERWAQRPRRHARVPAGAHTLGVALIRRHDIEGVDDLFAVHAESSGIASFTVTAHCTRPAPATRQAGGGSLAVSRPAPPRKRRARRRSSRGLRRTPIGDRSPPTIRAGDVARFLCRRPCRRLIRRRYPARLGALARDPEFIFRIEAEPAELPAGNVYRVSDVDLASRLSFFLWSSIPDDALLATAAAGELHQPAVLAREVQRMLADPKSDALVTSFAAQWLQLRLVDTVSPETREFDGNLRQALRKETELLFASVLREDRSVIDLLDADYTFVDERLARHYGLPNIGGSRFRRVELPSSSPRRGLLGHGSILTLTSAPNRTSPVKRGQWVLNNLLGTPAPQPPTTSRPTLRRRHRPARRPPCVSDSSSTRPTPPVRCVTA